MERAAKEPYPTGHCPAGVLLLLASVDVQDTWLEIKVKGYGRGEESWLIWHEKVYGDPAQDEVWTQIDSIRRTEFPLEGGGTLKARHCAVDTGGHFTNEAYDYCRRNAREGVVAIKGSSTRAAPALGKGSKQDVNLKGRTIKGGVTLYMVGTDTLKRTVYARLKISEPGPGFCHFGQNATDEYLAGLTSERLMPKMVKGFTVLEWHKHYARNEPLDLEVYCLATLELVKRRYNRATMWDQLEAQLGSAKPDTGGPLSLKGWSR
jgi:phage terminase large subunit GpA-like protein